MFEIRIRPYPTLPAPIVLQMKQRFYSIIRLLLEQAGAECNERYYRQDQGEHPHYYRHQSDRAEKTAATLGAALRRSKTIYPVNDNQDS